MSVTQNSELANSTNVLYGWALGDKPEFPIPEDRPFPDLKQATNYFGSPYKVPEQMTPWQFRERARKQLKSQGPKTERVVRQIEENLYQLPATEQIDILVSGIRCSTDVSMTGAIRNRHTHNNFRADYVAFIERFMEEKRLLTDAATESRMDLEDIYTTVLNADWYRYIDNSIVNWWRKYPLPDGRYVIYSDKPLTGDSIKLGKRENIDDFMHWSFFTKKGKNVSSKTGSVFSHLSKESVGDAVISVIRVVGDEESMDKISEISKKYKERLIGLTPSEIEDLDSQFVEEIEKVIEENENCHELGRYSKKVVSSFAIEGNVEKYSKTGVEEEEDEELRILKLTEQGKWSRNHPSVNG